PRAKASTKTWSLSKRRRSQIQYLERKELSSYARLRNWPVGNTSVNSNIATVHEADIVAEGSLGTVIRRLRARRNLSLQRLAELSDVSVGMLSHIERDMTSP